MAKRLYIAIHEQVPIHMMPVLVAHTVLGAHLEFTASYNVWKNWSREYEDWLDNSFKKVVVRLSDKEWTKLIDRLDSDDAAPAYLGYESTVMEGADSCLVYLDMDDLGRPLPNVLKFAKLLS